MSSTCDSCGYTSEWTMEMLESGTIICDRCLKEQREICKSEGHCGHFNTGYGRTCCKCGEESKR